MNHTAKRQQSRARLDSDQIALTESDKHQLTVQWESFDCITGEALYAAMRVLDGKHVTRWHALTLKEVNALQRHFLEDMRKIAAGAASIFCGEIFREVYGTKNPRKAWLLEEKRRVAA
jgi:hypothetical protein